MIQQEHERQVRVPERGWGSQGVPAGPALTGDSAAGAGRRASSHGPQDPNEVRPSPLPASWLPPWVASRSPPPEPWPSPLVDEKQSPRLALRPLVSSPSPAYSSSAVTSQLRDLPAQLGWLFLLPRPIPPASLPCCSGALPGRPVRSSTPEHRPLAPLCSLQSTPLPGACTCFWLHLVVAVSSWISTLTSPSWDSCDRRDQAAPLCGVLLEAPGVRGLELLLVDCHPPIVCWAPQDAACSRPDWRGRVPGDSAV